MRNGPSSPFPSATDRRLVAHCHWSWPASSTPRISAYRLNYRTRKHKCNESAAAYGKPSPLRSSIIRSLRWCHTLPSLHRRTVGCRGWASGGPSTCRCWGGRRREDNRLGWYFPLGDAARSLNVIPPAGDALPLSQPVLTALRQRRWRGRGASTVRRSVLPHLRGQRGVKL
ncbi:hypothetical protein ASPZODRAFT_1183748 [Penicilliopsis zonata CBS 506.65]|uniref:Uncharacterized protein n=1 Tax=Penicilliopsis zonata CBS 506.65 TaxID=1073090 RepID=A0A1L9S7W4_9EURO|nr:hypothetical protein ASPZODRAFT_1183748 [Penicilliopsis zonata CBS 506.65]OJJ43244.1 hypothetical protein ASPZODRAFT_1183748 [Penicilliopsis zonata CBS 506.65]